MTERVRVAIEIQEARQMVAQLVSFSMLAKTAGLDHQMVDMSALKERIEFHSARLLALQQAFKA